MAREKNSFDKIDFLSTEAQKVVAVGKITFHDQPYRVDRITELRR
jgi:hypothetical protein